VGAWKIGWTKAPSTVSFWTMLSTSYEILTIEMEGQEPHKETSEGFCYVEHEDEGIAATKDDSTDKDFEMVASV